MGDDRRRTPGRRTEDQVATELGRLAKEAGQVLDRFEDSRTEVVESVREAKESVDNLAEQVKRLVPRHEVVDVEHGTERSRKRIAVALLWTIVVAVQIVDFHTVATFESRATLSGWASFVADLFFPTHIHGGDPLWPTKGNAAGLVFYTVLAMICWRWLTWTGKTVIEKQQEERQ